MAPIPKGGTVAVTGSAGFLGGWVVRLLLDKGYRVRACVRDADDGAKTEFSTEKILDVVLSTLQKNQLGEEIMREIIRFIQEEEDEVNPVSWTSKDLCYMAVMPWCRGEYVGETSRGLRHRVSQHLAKARKKMKASPSLMMMRIRARMMLPSAPSASRRWARPRSSS